MDKYQHRLLQLSIPTRTDKKEQEAFLREIYEKHIDAHFHQRVSPLATSLFAKALEAYHVDLPDYILATVYSIQQSQLAGKY